MSSLMWRWVTAFVIAGAIIVSGGWAYSTNDSRHHQLAGAIWTTAVVLLLILLLLERAASARASGNNYGYLDAIVGADGRISTSKTVVFIWTLELGTALALLGAVVVWDRSASTADQIFGSGDNWDGYFLLLGGPFAAAIVAKGITTTTAIDPTAKPVTADASPAKVAQVATVGGNASAGDIVTNDDGTVSFADSQYAIFSFIAGLYFVGALIGNVISYGKAAPGVTPTIGLPSIPSALLGLTSAAALAYVGNKAVSTQGTRLSSLAPNPVTNSVTVSATLVNLPDTASVSNVYITAVNSTGTATTLAPTKVQVGDGIVEFAAPPAADTYQVVIHTTGYSTPGLTLKVT
jgi:hypothetical protein